MRRMYVCVYVFMRVSYHCLIFIVIVTGIVDFINEWFIRIGGKFLNDLKHIGHVFPQRKRNPQTL